MKKNKIYTVIGVLALLVLNACSLHEEDNLFDDSSANRVSNALKTYKEILTAPENGWIMRYYPGEGQALGGYNILVSFAEDGKVKVAGELSGANEEVTSLYSLKQSAGPILIFDSYNDIMHFFSEPLNGLGGDFEFSVMSATPDEVILSGKKSLNMISLIQLPKEQKWSEYLQKVAEVQKSIFLGTFQLMVNGKEIGNVSQDNNVFTLTYSGAGPLDPTLAMPFVYTDDGIKLYEPITIDGVTMSTFKADVDNVSYVCTDAGVDAELAAFYPPGYRFYDALVGTYKMGTRTVTVAANPDLKSYTVTGFYSRGSVQAEYARAAGTISIKSQYVGMALGYYGYLCVWNTIGGNLTWMEGSGMIGLNSQDEPLTISFKDNGVWGEADSFIGYAFSGQPPTNSNAVGTLDRIVAPVLVKQN